MINLDKAAFENELGELLSNHEIAILCLGNEERGNDGVGIYIGTQLKTRLPDEINRRIVLGYNAPVNVLGSIVHLHPTLLLVIDAVYGDFTPGKIIICDPDFVSDLSSQSTHYQDLSQIQLYLERFAQENILVKFLGISIKDATLLTDISDEIKREADFIIEKLEKILKEVKSIA